MKDVAVFLAVVLVVAFMLTGDPPVSKLLHLVVVKKLTEALHETDCTLVPYP